MADRQLARAATEGEVPAEVQLNQDQPFSYSRDELVRLLDEALDAL